MGVALGLAATPHNVFPAISLKFDVFPHCFASFCAVCLQAMTHSVANVPSQQAMVVVGRGF